VVAVE
jgi:transposase InsO family protein